MLASVLLHIYICYTDARLKPHVPYVFYIRAWYDANSYVIYQTSTIKTDSLSPELSKSYKIKEVRNSASTAEIDYLTSTGTVHTKWPYVFRDSHVAISGFEISLGSYPGGSDIVQAVTNGVTTTSTLYGGLREGQKYYVTVEATNYAKLYNQAVSDGFIVS